MRYGGRGYNDTSSKRDPAWLAAIALLLAVFIVAYVVAPLWIFIAAWFLCAAVAGVVLGVRLGYQGAMERALWVAAAPWAAFMVLWLFEAQNRPGLLESLLSPGALLLLVAGYAGVALGVIGVTLLQEGWLALRTRQHWRSHPGRNGENAGAS